MPSWNFYFFSKNIFKHFWGLRSIFLLWVDKKAALEMLSQEGFWWNKSDKYMAWCNLASKRSELSCVRNRDISWALKHYKDPPRRNFKHKRILGGYGDSYRGIWNTKSFVVVTNLDQKFSIKNCGCSPLAASMSSDVSDQFFL